MSGEQGGSPSVRVQGVLPYEVYKKYKEVINRERKKAGDSFKPTPSESSILAMLVARGIISYWAHEEE